MNKAIHCPTLNDFEKTCKLLQSHGYCYPSGGLISEYNCSYYFKLGMRYINLYPDTKLVKFGSSEKGIKNAKNFTIIESNNFSL